MMRKATCATTCSVAKAKSKPKAKAKSKSKTKSKAKSKPKLEVKIAKTNALAVRLRRLQDEPVGSPLKSWLRDHRVNSIKEWHCFHKLDNESLAALVENPPSGSTESIFRAIQPSPLVMNDNMTKALRSSIDDVWAQGRCVGAIPVMHAALRAYTVESALCYHLNRSLREAKGIADWNPYNQWLTKAHVELVAQHSPVAQTLYRGVAKPYSELDHKYKEGEVYVWAAWTSCTIDQRVANDFTRRVDLKGPAGTLFHIRSSRAIDLRPWSVYPAEDEFLLRPPFLFRVDNVTLSISEDTPSVISLIECEEEKEGRDTNKGKQEKKEDKERKEGKEDKEEKKKSPKNKEEEKEEKEEGKEGKEEGKREKEEGKEEKKELDRDGTPPIEKKRRTEPLDSHAGMEKDAQRPANPCILLVNDKSADIDQLIDVIQLSIPTESIRILRASNRFQALHMVVKLGKLVYGVVTNMTQVVNGNTEFDAGLKLAHDIRNSSNSTPICFYYKSSTLDSQRCDGLAPWLATTREPDVIQWLKSIVRP